MKRPLLASAVVHLLLVCFLAFAPTPSLRLLPRETVIPVSLQDLPSPPRAQASQPAAPAPSPVRESPRAPRGPALPLQREEAPPDLLAKLTVPAIPDTDLRERIDRRKSQSVAALPAPPVAPLPTPPRPVATPGAPPPPPVQPPPPPPRGAGGGEVTLTTSTFPYGWYVTMVRTKLLESWSPPQRLSTIGSPASALLTFRISRGGVVSGVALVTSSGYTLLDRSALEALRSLGTLPPLPAAYREDHLDVVVTFSPAGV